MAVITTKEARGEKDSLSIKQIKDKIETFYDEIDNIRNERQKAEKKVRDSKKNLEACIKDLAETAGRLVDDCGSLLEELKENRKSFDESSEKRILYVENLIKNVNNEESQDKFKTDIDDINKHIEDLKKLKEATSKNLIEIEKK